MAEFNKEKKILLRNYSKAIFFWPLLVISFIFWIIQALLPEINIILGYIWCIIFFFNLFIISFDFPPNKFLILVLGVVLTLLILIFLILPQVQLPIIVLNLGSSPEFYATMTLILGIILGFVVLSARFDYYKLERNELIHVTGVLANTAERYPVRSLRIRHVVSDVFEFLLLGAGSVTLIPKDSEAIHLITVINVKKKMKKIDWLLTHEFILPSE
jgi:hypothetical protein